ncbi:MAG TPA: hypothetical protein VG675_14465 [Bryobacteraceae bacterium]|nr:hypothetical protein [Bryobacteraceae bacterium]
MAICIVHLLVTPDAMKSLKLAELRARTDHDLLRLVARQVERSIALAGQADQKQSPAYLSAQTGYTRARRLLPVIYGLTSGQRNELTSRLQQLRLALETVPGGAVPVDLPKEFEHVHW